MNNDFKIIIKAVKLLLLKCDNELRWNITSHQIAYGDLERYEDDSDKKKRTENSEHSFPTNDY